MTNRGGLLLAFDGALAAVRRLQAAELQTTGGASAAPQLARLRADLEGRRAEIAGGGAFDRAWAGGLVRSVAEWLPEHELPLLARLGHLIRLGSERP